MKCEKCKDTGITQSCNVSSKCSCEAGSKVTDEMLEVNFAYDFSDTHYLSISKDTKKEKVGNIVIK